MISLETERLKLRQFSAQDFDTYAQWMSNSKVMKFVGSGTPRSRDEAWNNLALVLGHWQLREYGLWAVERKDTGELIGRIGLFNPAGWPGLEVGWLLDPSHWGKGYAQEGARAAIDFAFNQLKQNKLISLIHPDNESSIRVALRLGMEYEREIEIAGKVSHIYALENLAE